MLGSQAINWQGGECGDPVIQPAAIIALIFRNMPGAGNAWNEYRNVVCLFLECRCHDCFSSAICGNGEGILGRMTVENVDGCYQYVLNG